MTKREEQFIEIWGIGYDFGAGADLILAGTIITIMHLFSALNLLPIFAMVLLLLGIFYVIKSESDEREFKRKIRSLK